jgi:flagellar motor switch protein FliM
VTDVSMASVEQMAYGEFLAALPDPTAFYAVTMEPLESVGALELNPVVAFSMIDRMLGGTGRGVNLSRALTEIEQNVVDGIVKLILENLADTWRTIHEVHFRISGRETRPQMLQVAAPNETVHVLAFDVRLVDARGLLNLCVPAPAIQAIGDTFVHTWFRSRHTPTPAHRMTLARVLARVNIPVAAQLETAVRARELLELRVGDVLSVGKPVSHPIVVRLGRTPKFTGRQVPHDSRAAVPLADGSGSAGRSPLPEDM